MAENRHGQNARSLRRLAVLPLILAGLVTLSATGTSQTAGEPSPIMTGPGESLPVTGVTLFTTGVGYFQHDGVVSGDVEITLAFDVGDVNDLLKSMVLQDFDGGTVEAVTYPSQDPLSRILGSFSIDIGDNPSLSQLLIRARGEAVTIRGDQNVTGTILGIEQRTQVIDGTALSVPVLNLSTLTGMLQVVLLNIDSISFQDPSLQNELEAALAVIASNRQQDKKLITIRFAGSGERRVRVGYIRQVPVWKTSYRVVLADDDTAQLQGWAMVENTGETDWFNVQVALVSGQPISFVMDLYSPKYVTRPVIRQDYGVSVAPQQYDRAVAVEPRAYEAAPSMAPSAMRSEMAMADDVYGYEEFDAEPEPIDLNQGVTVAAQSEGESVYRITHPLSVPRRGAAMLPIVGSVVPAQRISVFDRSAHSSRALQAVRLTNTAGLQLPAGPATIFDGATYGGDTQIPALVDEESRLLSFAVDLHSAIIVRSQTLPELITRLRIVNGYLESTLRQELSTEYVIERIGDDDALHLIVHPKRPGWELTNQTPVSETQSTYRFEVPVPAGETTTFQITEERIRSQTFGLLNVSDSQITYFVSQETIDAETISVLSRLKQLRGIVASREAQRRQIETEINTIYREQDRIRRNMEVLETDSDLYQRYSNTLGDQEDRLAELAELLTAARVSEQEARNDLATFVEGV